MKYRRLYYSNPDLDKMTTIRDMIARAKKEFPDRLAYRQFENRVLESAISFRGLAENVDSLGTALLAKGLSGKHFGLLGESSIEWFTSYLAVVCGVGVALPLDKELGDETMAHQIRFGDVSVVFCSAKLLPKLKRILPSCPDVTTVVVMRDGKPELGGNIETLSHSELIKEGHRMLLSGDNSYVDAVLDPEKMIEIVYTSGTTGANKGVMLSHKNLMSMMKGMRMITHFEPETISVLPINHTYELGCTYIASLYEGTTVCINDDLKRVLQNINHFAPSMSLMVPMMLELIARKIRTEIEKNGLTNHVNYARNFSNMLLKVGIDMRRTYFKPILSKFGGNLRTVICGGAALSADVRDFLTSIGIVIREGYGITECSPVVAIHADKFHHKGSVGYVLPTVKVRIMSPGTDGNGEVQVKGDSVMLGYYKMPEDTKAVFTEDGWFKTGDLGHLDKDGFLFITGRIKNLIILSNGKNVYPEEVEEHLQTAIPYLEEVVVLADQSNTGIYAVCYLNPEFCKEHDLNTEKEKYEYIMKDVSKYNSKSETFKRITNVQISETEFEKTTTKKIKRYVVERKMQNV